MTERKESDNRRVFGLDVLRAWAIIWVVLFHLLYLAFDSNDITHWNPIFRWTIGWGLMMKGPFGVDLFFVLSGYLITSILLRDVKHTSHIHNFWLSRWLRTLPPYFAALFGCWLVLTWQHKSFNIIPYLFFLQNQFPPNDCPFAVSWSLCLEEWFYLLLPFATLAILKTPKNLQKLCWLVILVLPVFLRAFYQWNGHWYNNLAMIFRYDGLAIGMWIALQKFENNRLWFFLQKQARRGWICSMILWIVLCKQFPLQTQFLEYFLAPFTFGLLLVDSLTWKRWPSWIAKWVEAISLSSYSIYLIHAWPIEWFKKDTKSMQAMIYAFTLIIILGSLYYFLIEIPTLSYRKKFLAKRKFSVKM